MKKVVALFIGLTFLLISGCGLTVHTLSSSSDDLRPSALCLVRLDNSLKVYRFPFVRGQLTLRRNAERYVKRFMRACIRDKHYYKVYADWTTGQHRYLEQYQCLDRFFPAVIAFRDYTIWDFEDKLRMARGCYGYHDALVFRQQ